MHLLTLGWQNSRAHHAAGRNSRHWYIPHRKPSWMTFLNTQPLDEELPSPDLRSWRRTLPYDIGNEEYETERLRRLFHHI